MSLWMTSNTFGGLLNYRGAKAQKPSLSRFSMGRMCSSSGPLFWLWSAFSEAQFVTRRQVKHSHPPLHAAGHELSLQHKHCWAWMNSALLPAAWENLVPIPFHIDAFGRHTAHIFVGFYIKLLLDCYTIKCKIFLKLIQVLVKWAQKGKKGDGVHLGDQSVLRFQGACLYSVISWSGKYFEAVGQQDSTFQNSGATHIEFNDVVYQVARDGMTIHLVDDHLLQR